MASPVKSSTIEEEREWHLTRTATNNKDNTLQVGEKIYLMVDPLDPRKIALDIFEVYCHEMLCTKFIGRRAYLIIKMRYMIHRLIGNQYDYGRLYNRTCVANLVARVGGRHSYVVPDQIEVQEGDQSCHLVDCLVQFTPDKWKKIMDQFADLRESLLRNDACLIVLPTELDGRSKNDDDEEDQEGLIPEENDSVNETLEKHADFTKGYHRMMDLIKFHTCLSHLQPDFETAIQNGDDAGAESIAIPYDNIVAFDSAIEEEFGDDEDSKCAAILKDLLDVNKNVSRSTRYAGLHLKSFKEVKAIFAANSRMFDLDSFQQKFLQLLRRWADLVLPIPNLSKLNYGSTTTGSNAAAVMVANNKENKPGAADGVDSGKTISSFVTAESTSGKQQQPTRPQRGLPQHKRAKYREDRKPPPVETTEVNDELESSSDEEEYEKAGKMGAREQKRAAQEQLKRKRDDLMKKVKDPLQDCIAAAEGARTHKEVDESEDDDSSDEDVLKRSGKAAVGRKKVKTPSFRMQKKSAHQLKFTDSEESGSEEEGGVALSELPTKYKSKSNKPAQAPREIHVSRKSGGKQKRKRFTEEEDGAIRLGVDRCGEGKWADIKSYYSMELRDRTQVQLKDRWRTLNK